MHSGYLVYGIGGQLLRPGYDLRVQLGQCLGLENLVDKLQRKGLGFLVGRCADAARRQHVGQRGQGAEDSDTALSLGAGGESLGDHAVGRCGNHLFQHHARLGQAHAHGRAVKLRQQLAVYRHVDLQEGGDVLILLSDLLLENLHRLDDDGLEGLDVDLVSEVAAFDQVQRGLVEFVRGLFLGLHDGLQSGGIGAEEYVAAALGCRHLSHSQLDGSDALVLGDDWVVAEDALDAVTGHEQDKRELLEVRLLLGGRFFAGDPLLHHLDQVDAELLRVQHDGSRPGIGVEARPELRGAPEHH